MISPTFPPLSSTPFSFRPKPRLEPIPTPTPTPTPIRTNHNHHNKNLKQRRSAGNFTCRAELSQDAPFAVAIGACILNSLVFPVPSGPHDDDDGDSVIDSSDARLAVMGIISFIPYFNWLSWVFAYLDTQKRRYVVYALVYLAPYVRWNLSLSPEESWLPITSILLCIIHIQLEASINNGDLQGFQIFSNVEKHPPRKKDFRISKEGKRNDNNQNLPSAQEESRNEIGGWGVPRKPPQDPQHLKNENGEINEEEKKY